MVKLLRLCPLAALYCLLLPGAAWAAVSAQLSEQVIDELETTRLVIRATGTRQTRKLDLSALEKDFVVLGNNTSSQYRLINGREQSWVDYQITLQPKRTGELTIPPIKVGEESTPTIGLSVRPLTNETRRMIDELVFFEQDISADTVYVQSQLVVTRRLLYSNGVQLYSDLPDAPDLPDAVVMTLGEASSSTTSRNGKRYGVVEQKYAIFPELSGQLTIPAINVTASVRLIENGRVSRKGVRVGTGAQTIVVRPIPATYPPDQPWLPAEHVQLPQVLTPNQPEYAVGDTLTHELLIYIQGNLGSIAPPLPLPVDRDEFRAYPQNPVIEDDTRGNGVAGSRLQTTSLLPLQAGQLNLPAVRLTWWNTRTDKLEVAAVAAASLATTGTAVTPAGAEAANAGADKTPAGESVTPAQPATSGGFTDAVLWIAGLAAGAGILLLLVTAARRLLRRWQRHGKRQPSARNLHNSLQRNLQRSLQFRHPHDIEQALGAYLAHVYGIGTTRAMARFRRAHADAGPALDSLLRNQYSISASTGIPVDEQTVQRLQTALDSLQPGHTAKADELPPLYPHEQQTAA